MVILNYKDKINNLISSASNIFIMGHRYADLDAIGGAIGAYEYVKAKGKYATIVLNDKTLEKGVKKVLDKVKDNYDIKRSIQIKKKIDSKSLLIIVDTNKDYLLQDQDLLEEFDKVLVIDHHDINDHSIKRGTVIIDDDASSTCEMIMDLLDNEKIKIDENVATILLSGIVLDTNNYVIKTTSDTFRLSYLLTKSGAKPLNVQYLLKQDLKEYVERQKVITNVKQIKNVALSKGISSIKYRREDLAKIADTLLQFDKIKASFVIGKLENGDIGISARSLGEIDVGKVLEKFNGGGDENEAGACISNRKIKEVEKELYSIIKTFD